MFVIIAELVPVILMLLGAVDRHNVRAAESAWITCTADRLSTNKAVSFNSHMEHAIPISITSSEIRPQFWAAGRQNDVEGCSQQPLDDAVNNKGEAVKIWHGGDPNPPSSGPSGHPNTGDQVTDPVYVYGSKAVAGIDPEVYIEYRGWVDMAGNYVMCKVRLTCSDKDRLHRYFDSATWDC